MTNEDAKKFPALPRPPGEELKKVVEAMGSHGYDWLLMGHIWGREIAEDDFKLLSPEDTYPDICDCCCEERVLIAMVRSIPEEDVWLDLVCHSCLRRLLGQEEWVQ